MIVIGLTGYAEHGKSTVADHLVAAHGFTKLSFATALKEMLYKQDPWVSTAPALRLSDALSICGSEANLKLSDWGQEYRRLMQTLATDCIRAVDEDFWVRAALAKLEDPEGRYVFDDVRFPNEAGAVAGVGWDDDKVTALWNVVRPGHQTGTRAHVSEEHAGKLGEDYVIVNDNGLSNLRLQTDLALGATVNL